MYNLKIVSNRSLCEDGLYSRIKNLSINFIQKDSKVCIDDFYINSLILREKDLSESEYENLLLEIKPLCDKFNINVVPHKYWKLAMDLKIKNIHLPYNEFLSVLESNYKCEFFDFFEEIGVSIHSKEEAVICEKNGATYVTFGHVFKTKCKEVLEPRGLKQLKNVINSVQIPVFAIGGIGLDNYKEAIDCGADGVCIMSMYMKGR